MTSVPFSISNVYGGLGFAQGVLRNDADNLVLEFQLKDSVFGLLRSRVRQVCIPISAIEEIALERMLADPWQWLGLGGIQLRIRTMDLSSVKDIPGHGEDGFRLRIKRKYRRAVRTFVSEVELRIAEMRLLDIEALQGDGRQQLA
jgi:hypothetical protein